MTLRVRIWGCCVCLLRQGCPLEVSPIDPCDVPMMRWLLPEAFSDILPTEARQIEELRRRLLDLARSYGYELVQPPMVEHLDSLAIGRGGDLDLRTFKLVDQLSGRTLGLRPDMTPQVARIDAQRLDRSGVVRLAYCGSVLHARPGNLGSTREPIQIGAEIYGHEGLEADLEAIDLMLASLRSGGVDEVRVDLCHLGLVRALLAQDPRLDEEVLFPLFQRKDLPGLSAMLAQMSGLSPVVMSALLALPALYGSDPTDVLTRARAQLPAVPAVLRALDELEKVVSSALLARRGGASLAIDLGDLRGYRYHTGITFAAYVSGRSAAIARGGRYDNIGSVFGRGRPATGFSLELRELAALADLVEPSPAVRAPWLDDRGLAAAILQLRAAGEIVVQTLPGHEQEQEEFRCDRELCFMDGAWQVRRLIVNPPD